MSHSGRNFENLHPVSKSFNKAWKIHKIWSKPWKVYEFFTWALQSCKCVWKSLRVMSASRGLGFSCPNLLKAPSNNRKIVRERIFSIMLILVSLSELPYSGSSFCAHAQSINDVWAVVTSFRESFEQVWKSLKRSDYRLNCFNDV